MVAGRIRKLKRPHGTQNHPAEWPTSHRESRMTDHLKSAPVAYQNEAFLNSPDGRILRMLAEYQEPLARFRREQIQDTVVFFGSARFTGSKAAAETSGYDRAEPLALASPAQLEQDLKRAQAGVDMARYYEDARTARAHADQVVDPDSRPPSPFRRHHGRRPGHHGSGQPRRARSRRQERSASTSSCRSSSIRTSTSRLR